VISASGESSKRFTSFSDKTGKPKTPTDSVSKSTSPNKDKSAFCVYCKNKRHIRAECYKLKRKEQTKASAASSSTPVVAAIGVTDPAPSKAPGVQDDPVIAAVHVPELKKLEISNYFVTIDEINEVPCSCTALLDSGSAISFVKLNAFKRIFGTNVSIDRVPYDNIYAANDLEIEASGLFKARLRLNVLPNFTPSVVLVISDNFRWPADMLLGRDFLINNQISVLYTPPKTDDYKAKVELFSNVAFADVIDIPKNSFSLTDIQTDFELHIHFCTSEICQNACKSER